MLVKNQTIHYDDKYKAYKIKLLKLIDYFDSHDAVEKDYQMFYDEI